MPKLKPSRRAIFTELTAGNLQAGKPFDGLAPLDGVLDMYGQAVTITAGDIDAYLANTLAMIESTRTEGGELVGLPIDADNHDKGDAAGWIVGAKKVGKALIQLLPRWTKIGIELIGEKIRAGFSPTLDLENKAILGGSLTNWPASRNKKSQWLLRPIELSTGLFTRATQELSMDNEQILVAFADMLKGMDGMSAPENVQVSDIYVACTIDGVNWHVPYTVDGNGAVTFATQDNWEEVKPAPAPPVANAMGPTKRPATRKEKDMGNFSELSAQVAQLAAAVAAMAGKQSAPPTTPAPAINGVDLSEVFNLSGVTEQGRAQVQAWATHQAELVRQQVELAQAQALLQIQRDNRYTELSQRLTGGTADAPRGLKGTTAEELKKHLMALPTEEAKYFGELLETNVKGGLVEFSEVGHGKQAKGRLELPAEVKRSLAAKEITVADLGNPILGLGDLAQYNLSAYAGKE